ncbi:hypothetical protein BOSP111201_01880 [Bordetella sputigena]|uniref:hypothetical protein n=1 Tax=Bordetella sputigena TaxID=1416810 RepID=UPI0039EEA89F
MRRGFFVLGLFVALWCSRALADANTNTGVLTVLAIKASWAADGNNGKAYRYWFAGDFGTGDGQKCKDQWWALAGDDNVNNLLQQAYLSNIPIKIGILSPDSNCYITTVEWQQ